MLPRPATLKMDSDPCHLGSASILANFAPIRFYLFFSESPEGESGDVWPYLLGEQVPIIECILADWRPQIACPVDVVSPHTLLSRCISDSPLPANQRVRLRASMTAFPLAEMIVDLYSPFEEEQLYARGDCSGSNHDFTSRP